MPFLTTRSNAIAIPPDILLERTLPQSGVNRWRAHGCRPRIANNKEVRGNMEFGVLFTSHPNPKEEPYPHRDVHARTTDEVIEAERLGYDTAWIAEDRKSTRLNSSHLGISYAVFCLKKKKQHIQTHTNEQNNTSI